MSFPSSGGRFASSDCYALLSREAEVIDLSGGMRDLCQRIRLRGEVPTSFKSLVTERDHPVLLEHLERVWSKQESDMRELRLGGVGATLNARIFSIPALSEKAVQSFLAIEGNGEETSANGTRKSTHRRPGADERRGFMILRPDGDFGRLLITFCDPQLREALGVSGRTLVNRSIYQVFTGVAGRSVLDAIREARMSGEPRRCAFKTEAGLPLQGMVFVTNGSVMLLAETKSMGAPGVDRSHPQASSSPAEDFNRFLRFELRPGLRALRNLARSLETTAARDQAESHRIHVLEQLASQICDAVEALDGQGDGHAPGAGEGDIMARLVDGVRAIVHPALAGETRSLAVVHEVPPTAGIISPYSLSSLQQVLVDLLGEAATAVAQPDLECQIRLRDENAARAVLEFCITARGTEEEGSFSPFEEGSRLEALRRRPMFKACRRFLKALGTDLKLDPDAESATFRYRFALAFGKLSALQTA